MTIFSASTAETTNIITDRPLSSIYRQMPHHLWFKSPISACRMGQTVRFNLNARCCAKFGQENGASEGETHAINACCINWRNSQGRLCVNSYLIQTRVTKNLINQSKFTDEIVKNTFLCKAFLGETVEPENGQF